MMPNRTSSLQETKRQTAGTAAWCMAAYIMIAIGRITEIVPGLGSVPIAKIAFALALIGAFSSPKSLSRVSLRSIRTSKAAILFFSLAILSLTFSIWKGGSLKVILNDLSTLILSFVLIAKCGSSWSAVRVIHLGFVGAATLLTLNTMLSYSGGRAGEMSSYDPNDTAFMLVCLTPLVIAYALSERGAKKLAIWGIALLAVLAALLTQSRGGLLGLVTISIGMTLFPLNPPDPEKLGKKKPLGAFSKLLLMLVAAIVMWNFLPGETRERLATIVHPKDDYNMNMNEEGRLAIWERNLNSVMGRPIGFGIGCFGAVDLRSGGQFRAAHNSFVQVLVELGILGLILYLRTYVVAFREIKRMLTIKSILASTSPFPLMRAARMSLIGSLVCGFFLSQAYSNLIWLLFAMIASISAVTQGSENDSPAASKRSSQSRNSRPLIRTSRLNRNQLSARKS